MNPTETDTRFSTIALGMFVGLSMFIITALISSDAKPENVALTPEAIAEYIVDEMPESYLQRNLFIVFGAEYSDSSKELNDLLSLYAQMKIEQMQKQQSKDSL